MTNPLRLVQLLKLLDVTRLNEADNNADVEAWMAQLPEISNAVAAFCVYPRYITLMRQHLSQQSMPCGLATVVNFPEGRQPLSEVLADINAARAAGASEIDCVLPYHTLLEGNDNAVATFLTAVRQAAEGLCLKVIIESGELLTAQQITKASELVIASGADFIKTSTGKVPVGVTLEAARIILTSIAAAERPVGFKASGGVRTVEQALALVRLYEEITGLTATSSGMRIGASALVSELSEALAAHPIPQ